MLQRIQQEHFQSLLGKVIALLLPDGSQLPIVIESVPLRPKSQLPGNERMPFGVALHTLEPTLFVDGLCAIELPDLGRVEDIFVSREPAMGRDDTLGYFNIVFN
ncbi:MAG: hypothetical protein JWR17_703 [Pseudomonas sp.]|uniref:DUF6916 family protein n=1 Tax=Pseudomonas sp. TaxID=306 RepID=UPI002631EF19|nr:hypothetical protein [Pseudomonas sp.]MDB6047957.1 hypothetical protein [Pseudomonas sp.]